MSEQNGESRFFSAAELRAYVENELKTENTDVHPHMGLVGDMNTLQFMNFMQSMYMPQNPDMPYRFEDTKVGQTIRKNVATKVGTKAIENGNVSQMKYITGMQDYSQDASGIHTLMELEKRLEQDAYVAYLFGHMGFGKTDFVFLNAEIGKKRLNLEIASNVRSFEQKDKYIYTYGQFLEWLTGGHKVESLQEVERLRNEKNLEIDASDKLFIFDEGSNVASGYAQDAYDTQRKLGNTVKLIRKVGGRLIIIGHTGKDVHPDIRRLSNDCITKTGKKTAIYYESVEEGKGIDKKFELSKIPKTNYTYDTLEISFWDWTLETPKELEEMGRDIKQESQQNKEDRNMEMAKAFATNKHPDIEANENGEITQEMLGDYYGISRQRVSQILSGIAEMANDIGGK